MEQAITTLMLTSLLYTQTTAVITRQTLKNQNFQLDCNDLMVLNGIFAFKEKIADVKGIPADVSVHWKTDSVFFTLVSKEMKMCLQTLRVSGEVENIKVAGLGQTTAVDNLNDIVYLGTDNGIYKYKDDGSISIIHYTALGKDIMYMAVNSDGSTMYIATWPHNRVYRINSDSQTPEKFKHITNGHGLKIDTRNNMYFVDVGTESLYVLKNGEVVPIKIKGLQEGKMMYVFVSRSDLVYVMDDNSNMYIVDPDNEMAKYLRNYNLTGVNTFGMDSADNVIVGIKGFLYKFYGYEKNPCNVIYSTHSRFEIGAKHQRRRRQKKDKKLATTTTSTSTSTTETYEDDDEDDDEEDEEE